MRKLPLGNGVYKRSDAEQPPVNLFNRFYEQDPTNLEEGSDLLSRAPTTFGYAIGQGPIRGQYTQSGAFSGDIFVVSGSTLWRYDGTTKTPITGTIQGSPDGSPEMVIVTGFDYEHLFIADGQLLQYYPGPSFATGTLTLTPSSPPDISTQEVEIGGVYYIWAAAISGSPTGTAGDPFQVKVGADDTESLENLLKAINASGVAGTDYSSTLTDQNTQVEALSSDATSVELQARERGSDGNTITTTIVSGSHLAFGGATLSGGGVESLFGVEVPSGEGIVSLDAIDGYVLAVQANSDRFWYINPGEVTIDPLAFYTAEKEADELVAVRVIGDQIIMLGTTTIEPWWSTGDAPAPDGDPFLPIDGAAIRQGVRSGTIARRSRTLIFVSDDNRVYKFEGGGVTPVSDHAIEEAIRKAREAELEA